MSLNYEQFLKLNRSNYDACFYNPQKGGCNGRILKKCSGKRPSTAKGDYPINPVRVEREPVIYGDERTIYYTDFSDVIGGRPVIRSQRAETPVVPLKKLSNYLDSQFECFQPYWSKKCV